VVDADRGWGIQVGAFSTQALAVSASRSALQFAAKPLVLAKIAAADPADGSVPVHRARLENLTQVEARKACEILISNNSPCFIYKAAQ
jgi:D-alanyl-D-alanine carboxypeptidase